jgi:hypothetical protein
MFARVSQLSIPPERIQDALGAFDDHVDPAIRMQPDFLGGLILADPETGKMLAVSLWEDEGAMHNTDDASYWFRAFGAQEAGGTVETVETYKVYRGRMMRPEPRSYQ